jgi:hypothetical protein
MLDEHLDPPEDTPLNYLDNLPANISKRKDIGLLEFDGRKVLISGVELYDWIMKENYSVHSAGMISANYAVIAMHDGNEIWDATFLFIAETYEIHCDKGK